MTVEEMYAIRPNEHGWRVLPNGNRVTLGDEVTLGDGVTLQTSPAQVQCHPYIVYPYSLTKIGVGCVIHEIDYWLRGTAPDELANHHECHPWSKYQAAIEFVAAWIAEEKKAQEQPQS